LKQFETIKKGEGDMRTNEKPCNRIYGTRRCLAKIRNKTCPAASIEECRALKEEGMSFRHDTLSGVFQKRIIA